MDLRYKSPAMRQKMAPADPPPMSENPDGEGGGGGGDEAPAGEKPTAFLPKELGGGKVWKAGDEIVLTVDAVDPETGELQVSYAPEKPDDSGEPPDTMAAMDQKLPEDSPGEGDY